MSPVMLKEIFHDGWKISKFTRICIENWVAKVVFLIQILLIFGGCCNHYFWGVWPKINRLPNFNMLFLRVLTKFIKSIDNRKTMWRHIFPLCWNRSRQPVSYPVFLLSTSKANCFCIYRKLIRWSTNVKGLFATTIFSGIFSATRPWNVGTLLQPFKQCCNAALR